MPVDEPLTLAMASERLLEDERLRSALADDEAQVLLDWALAALAAGQAAGAPLEPTVDRLRAIGRQVNDLVGRRQELTSTEMAERLRRLAGQPPPGPWDRLRGWLGRGDTVTSLVHRLPTLDGPTLVKAILALVPMSGHGPGTRDH
jgi:hypothetical protein